MTGMKSGYKDKITFRSGTPLFTKGNINASTYIPPPPPPPYPQFMESLFVYTIPTYVDGIQMPTLFGTFATYQETYMISNQIAYFDFLSTATEAYYIRMQGALFDGLSPVSNSIYRGLYSESYVISN